MRRGALVNTALQGNKAKARCGEEKHDKRTWSDIFFIVCGSSLRTGNSRWGGQRRAKQNTEKKREGTGQERAGQMLDGRTNRWMKCKYRRTKKQWRDILWQALPIPKANLLVSFCSWEKVWFFSVVVWWASWLQLALIFFCSTFFF